MARHGTAGRGLARLGKAWEPMAHLQINMIFGGARLGKARLGMARHGRAR